MKPQVNSTLPEGPRHSPTPSGETPRPLYRGRGVSQDVSNTYRKDTNTMSNHDSDRIVQIMPSTRGETAVFYEPEGNRWTAPVIAWALYADGSVWPLTASTEGDAFYAGEGALGWYLYQSEAEGVDWEAEEREAKQRALLTGAADRARAEARAKGLDREETHQMVRRACDEAKSRAEANR